MQENGLSVIPLGGLGEIGKNCTVLEYGDDILVIDAGIAFPENDMPGVDVVIPDYSYLAANRDRVRGIVLTHGHEDHIGGLPYLLQDVDAPIYATPLTRGLVEGKLRRHTSGADADLRPLTPNTEVEVGVFRVTPFHVNHSIPDAVGLAIRTPLGLIVHTGDFKIDHTPVEGKTIDMGTLAKLASEGVIMLLSDSTNAESPGYTSSESKLRDAFHNVFSRAQGRIIVATFASLLSRVQLAIETAAETGRRVAVAGRSMEQNTAIAEELGYVRYPAGVRTQLSEIGSLDDREVCVLATGSQGEPNAALARMASGRFRHVEIQRGDTVVLSSKAIPGNETQVYRNIDNLFQRGARVYYGAHAGLHVSGHAAQEELKLMLNLLRPLYFVPVHGEYRMLHLHAEMAYELGFDPEDVFVVSNGDRIVLTGAGATLGEPVPADPVFVDGSLVGDVGQSILRDRRALSQDGIVIARVTYRGESGLVEDDPEIISQGFVYVPESADLLRMAEITVADTVEQQFASCRDADEIGRHVKDRLRKLFYDETRRRPIIVPLISMS